jgi:hypothetical protein
MGKNSRKPIEQTSFNMGRRIKASKKQRSLDPAKLQEQQN